MISSLLYLTASRPDIMYATCLCAPYQAEPKESHLTAVKRIFRYLKGTSNANFPWRVFNKFAALKGFCDRKILHFDAFYPLFDTYCISPPNLTETAKHTLLVILELSTPNLDSWFDLITYSDSDFAGCKLDRKRTTGGCQLLGGKLVSWTSKKQNFVSTSTVEAEYDYDIQLSKIPIYYDNTSAITIANNPVLHSKTKHIEVRYHFIRDHVMNGDIELHFVPTEYQFADLFTKPLDVRRFNMLINELGMLNPDE
ncbi:hypothetical protein OSB04_006544 [Centaurea solstitialis]|uniref:Copia protein n=1 Tax=Centaurea solstitialis TaxID=347529 RepID=A0AA38TJW6_9ASTR|nr:hypothetical protein OSB04_006544 [Centaurea solstitialis]